TVQDLESFMATYTLPVEPGTRFIYSNVGAGTLGYVLALASGTSGCEGSIARDITEPLALTDTTVLLTPEQKARRAEGSKRGHLVPPNEIGTLGCGGALRSTVEDLLRFIEAAFGASSPEAAAAWQAILEPRRASPHGEDAHTGFLINIAERGSHV